MAVVQISRIQHRRGLATDLPQLAAGELGWSIDDQKLYIGNGKVSDGAPAVVVEGVSSILIQLRLRFHIFSRFSLCPKSFKGTT